jgi:hypothetical protein
VPGNSAREKPSPALRKRCPDVALDRGEVLYFLMFYDRLFDAGKRAKLLQSVSRHRGGAFELWYFAATSTSVLPVMP